MTKAAAGVITHEAYRRTSPLFWRHTTRCEQGRPCRPRSPGASVLRPLLAEFYLREQSTQTSSALLVPCGLDADTIDSHPRAMTVSATDARGWFSGKVNCHA